ncbi:MAG: hypothetical protein AUG51_15975 [Acidobacteria bacterium 13_1_20CM_3_53_8]|nr:MAG: hypothetical protein AUG51_15975 [Acidobacteria bacterium 13_1_20CM_3_53_8]
MLLLTIIALNATIAIYTSTIHNSGVIAVTDYLRNQHSKHYLSSTSNPIGAASPPTDTNMTVAFLMPCHSTPWRSHLIHPGIHGWALTCEPPLHLNATTRKAYLDEADTFYADPLLWLRSHMSRSPPRSPGFFGTRIRALNRNRDPEFPVGGRREWPDYLVFFEQLEGVMHTALQGSGYGECWRGFNKKMLQNKRKSVVEGAKQRGKEAEQLQQPQHVDGKTLALVGGRGPYGIGGDATHQQHREKSKPRAVPGDLTVDRPFWKRRERVVEQQDASIWKYLWPFAKQKDKGKRRWQGGKWS